MTLAIALAVALGGFGDYRYSRLGPPEIEDYCTGLHLRTTLRDCVSECQDRHGSPFFSEAGKNCASGCYDNAFRQAVIACMPGAREKIAKQHLAAQPPNVKAYCTACYQPIREAWLEGANFSPEAASITSRTAGRHDALIEQCVAMVAKRGAAGAEAQRAQPRPEAKPGETGDRAGGGAAPSEAKPGQTGARAGRGAAPPEAKPGQVSDRAGGGAAPSEAKPGQTGDRAVRGTAPPGAKPGETAARGEPVAPGGAPSSREAARAPRPSPAREPPAREESKPAQPVEAARPAASRATREEFDRCYRPRIEQCRSSCSGSAACFDCAEKAIRLCEGETGFRL